MSALTLVALVGSGAAAGLLGALLGIGGGVIIIPLLVLAFGIGFKVAVASSLIAVVATSTAAGSVYVGKGLANMRLGMVLEIFTTLGGITGGLLALVIPSGVLAAVFAGMIVVTAVLMLRGKDPHSSPQKEQEAKQDSGEGHEKAGSLSGSYYDPFQRRQIHYQAKRLPFGGAISFLAGILSGMLGVGGGFIKVPAMNLGMGLPIKVAAATSNFMIGVTAVSSLFVYFSAGYVHPMIAAPVALGVTGGALFGTRIAGRVSPNLLRRILSVLLLVIAVQMVLKSLGVHFG